MWHDLTHGRSSERLGDGAVLTRRSGFEFQVRPTFLWPQCSMIVLHVRRVLRAGAVDLDPDLDARVRRRLAARDRAPCRSAPASSPTGTSFGRPLGRTFTPLPPRSAGRSTNCLHVSMFFWTTAGSGDWNSQVAAAAPDVDAGVGELLADLLALLLAQRRLDAVLVARAQARRRRCRRCRTLSIVGKVPLGGDVVGDDAEAERTPADGAAASAPPPRCRHCGSAAAAARAEQRSGTSHVASSRASHVHPESEGGPGDHARPAAGMQEVSRTRNGLISV